MPDREKVIKGLECCVGYEDADNEFICVYERDNPNCPYSGTGSNETSCMTQLMRDALALLKAQEAKPVHVTAEINHRKIGECPNCGKLINSGDYPNYCGQCAQAVKWE